jgi:starch phosphorylase
MTGTRFSVEIRPILPERLKRLDELANDLYFSWNRGVRGLFRHLDEETWNACAHNPKIFLRRVPQYKLEAAARDPILLAEYRRVFSVYDTYMEDKPNTRTDRSLDSRDDQVAYFSAEFGFHESMPIYAGGLGILAADYCKAMSNLWVPFVGVGLLYRQGYFTQHILCGGQQVAHYPNMDPADLPVSSALDAEGGEIRVHVNLPGRDLELKVWETRVGHIRLYLLDSDVDSNSQRDRGITYQLYGGDVSTRIEQEIVLGMGGVRALRALGRAPTVWHINEGHASFLILERCLEYVRKGMDFDSALELVAANTVFTTHTPVPAGHDVFENGMMTSYFRHVITEFGIDDAKFLALGTNPRYATGFCTTTLAMRGSRYRNGVSRIHGRVASQMESYIWPDVPAEESPIGYVTNGTDVETFLGLSWVSLFDMYKGAGWRAKLIDKKFWQEFIDGIPNHVFLSVRQLLKAALLEDVHRRATLQYARGDCTKSFVDRLTRNLSPHNLDVLVIGFARRFATYKRATLIFHDLERLGRLLNDPERPVLILFAGKAHPSDVPGQHLLRQVYDISMRPEFQGKITLVENYNLSMTRELMPGVDVWLNTPEYPMEACGTSGMKAAINGAINLSVLDGWWAEAYDGENGWAITPHPTFDAEMRTQTEAIELMDILEHQVIPLFFERNEDGQPEGWIKKSKASMKSILPQFSSTRMAMDYLREYYSPAIRHGMRLAADNASGARTLAQWKAKVHQVWPKVRCRLAGPVSGSIISGQALQVDVEVFLDLLQPEDIVVEVVLGRETEHGEFVATQSEPFKLVSRDEKGEALYHCDLFHPEQSITVGGLQHFKVRVYPYHEMLNHRFECGCMLWL